MSQLKQLNWVDIFVAIILIRIAYIAVKTGFPTEIFKLLGIFSAIYIACHYYVSMGDFLSSFLPLKGEAWLNFLNILVFFILAFLGYFVFVIIRVVFGILIRMEAISLLNRWGAFILGLVRWSLSVSLLFFIFTISNIGYCKNSLSNSFSGPKLIQLTPKVYTFLWDNLISRFTGKQGFNKAVSEVGLNFSE